MLIPPLRSYAIQKKIECAKRWTDTLNPSIDRSTWTPEGDALLISAVNEHGKVWTKIVKLYFPGRTGLSAKNRLVCHYYSRRVGLILKL